MIKITPVFIRPDITKFKIINNIMKRTEFNTETGGYFIITVLSQNPSMFKLINKPTKSALTMIPHTSTHLINISRYTMFQSLNYHL